MIRARTQTGPPAPRRGVALVFVLWIMAVLSAVALKLGFTTHLHTRLTATVGQSTQALYLAHAGVERAKAEIQDGRNQRQDLADLREREDATYRNVELGDGTYTLYAGSDPGGRPAYGLLDECARINVAAAPAEVLARVPGLDSERIAEIMQLRKVDALKDVSDLLGLERLDAAQVLGEDTNGNGLLDPNENDGDRSWPPDNEDGRLNRGLCAYLTARSVARNVNARGKKRVNISSADVKQITSGVPGVSEQQAQSIVEHRKKHKFASIAGLLDVELLVKESARTAAAPQKPTRVPTKATSPTAPETKQPPPKKPGTSTQTPFKGTGAKAFDKAKLQEIADDVTVKGDELLKAAVNLKTAPAEVLACLPGLDEPLAARIVASRANRRDGFASKADLLDVEGITQAAFGQVCPHVDVCSDVFRVRSFGVVGNGAVHRCVEAVIDRTKENARVVYWRELE